MANSRLAVGGCPICIRAFTNLTILQIGHASAVADHMISTGHNIKWDDFEVLASGSPICIV